MSILLNLCDWLSLHETENYLKLKLSGTPYQLTLDDLMPIIKEKKLSVYWESKYHHYWINIKEGVHILFSNPKSFLTESQIKKEYMGERHKGYFLLELDDMDLDVVTIFNVWGGFQAAVFPVCYPVVARAIDNLDSKIAIVFDNAPFSAVDDSVMPLDLKFKYFDIQDLMNGFKFKRVDIDRIIATALGKSDSDITHETKERTLNPKTENSYLKLIQALAEYATNGLTGKHNTDANTIEAALREKEISCPVGNKALAGYLEKAQKLSK